MKLSEMRALDAGAFAKEVLSRKEELMKLRFQGAVGNIAQPHRVRELRREVARLMTIQNEMGRSETAQPQSGGSK